MDCSDTNGNMWSCQWVSARLGLTRTLCVRLGLLCIGVLVMLPIIHLAKQNLIKSHLTSQPVISRYVPQVELRAAGHSSGPQGAKADEKPTNVVDCVTQQAVRLPTLNKADTKPLDDLPPYLTNKESDDHRKNSFKEIFQQRRWGGDKNTIASSGPGSTLNSTKPIRRTLQAVIDYVKKSLQKPVITVLDAPCGDFVWMQELLKGREDVLYTGIDIVSDLVVHHSRVHRDMFPRWRFAQQDIVTTALNQSYDLVFTRQMTQHLVQRDAFIVFQHISRSGSKFLMATTYPGNKNIDINPVSEWRFQLQNLEAPPFSFSSPVCTSQEKESVVALWRLPLKRIV